jgi:hypothetical protein
MPKVDLKSRRHPFSPKLTELVKPLVGYNISLAARSIELDFYRAGTGDRLIRPGVGIQGSHILTPDAIAIMVKTKHVLAHHGNLAGIERPVAGTAFAIIVLGIWIETCALVRWVAFWFRGRFFRWVRLRGRAGIAASDASGIAAR